jgi:dihydrofolate reductase
MGKLVYLMNVSLDGYVADAKGSLDWSDPDEELLLWFNDQARGASAFVEGRRIFELMAAYWPTAHEDPNATPAMLEWQPLWVETPKIVFSRTIESAEWNSRVVSGDPAVELEALHREFEGDMLLGGPTLAAEFIQRDLVDEYRLAVHQVILGGGLPFFPKLERPINLELVEQRRTQAGIALLTYRPRRDA